MADPLGEDDATEKGHAVVGEIFTPIAQEGAAYLRQLDTATLVQLSEFMRFANRQQQAHAARLAEAD